jgi:hypothetical protein
MSSVLPGAGAFCIVPRSHLLTIEAAKALRTPEERTAFRANIAQNLGIDVAADGIEVCAQEGQCIVFNPMCLHSASNNTRPGAIPRHVVVCSFSHVDAGRYLRRQTQRIRYLYDWSPDMYEHMPLDLQSILENPALWGRHEKAQLAQFNTSGFVQYPTETMLSAELRQASARALRGTTQQQRSSGSGESGIGREIYSFLSVLKQVGEPLLLAMEEQANCALARALLKIDPAINTGPHGNIAHVMLLDVGCQPVVDGGADPSAARRRWEKSEVNGARFCHPLPSAEGDCDDTPGDRSDGQPSASWRLLQIPVEPVDIFDGTPQTAEITVRRRQQKDAEPVRPADGPPMDDVEGDARVDDGELSLVYSPNRLWKWQQCGGAGEWAFPSLYTACVCVVYEWRILRCTGKRVQ